MNKKVGSIVYATEQGLGRLAKDFYDNGIITDVLVVEHKRHGNKHKEWYPGAEVVNASKYQDIYKACKFCERMDTMLFIETPFFWPIVNHCRLRKVRTILMPMYEVTPWQLTFNSPFDMFLCPSKLDFQRYPSRPNCPSRYLPIPVPKSIQWRQRTHANVFVHNAGWGGLNGRNGTKELLEALKYVKSDINLILRSQKSIDLSLYGEGRIDYNSGKYQLGIFECGNVTINYRCGTFAYSDLYSGGDVFIFPEKFNGLSLPLQEAYASGMLVMSTNRYPMNEWLPNEPLIPMSGLRSEKVYSQGMEVYSAMLDPKDIANKIDIWAGMDISNLSLQGQVWGRQNSWEVLGPKYRELLGI